MGIVKKIYFNPHVKWILIPLFLLFGGFFFAAFIPSIRDTSFSVLTYYYNDSIFVQKTTGELLKNQKIVGKFKATDNNLGIVAIRFVSFNRTNTDHVIFRIKQSGNSKWYYSSIYPSLVFHENEFYPFGFPQLDNAKNNTYIFELISTNGISGNSIGLSHLNPIATAKYKYPIYTFLKNKSGLIVFIREKVIYLFTNSDLVYSLLIYLAPFILYILNLLTKKILFDKHPLIIAVSYFLLVDVVFITTFSFGIMLFILAFWIYIVRRYNFSSKTTLLMSIWVLIITIILNFFDNLTAAIKGGEWVYIFLMFATIQGVYELKNGNIMKE